MKFNSRFKFPIFIKVQKKISATFFFFESNSATFFIKDQDANVLLPIFFILKLLYILQACTAIIL